MNVNISKADCVRALEDLPIENVARRFMGLYLVSKLINLESAAEDS